MEQVAVSAKKRLRVLQQTSDGESNGACSQGETDTLTLSTLLGHMRATGFGAYMKEMFA